MGNIPKTLEECYEFIGEMLAESGDPYTRFMTPTEMQSVKGSLESQMEGYGLEYCLKGDAFWKPRKLLVTDVLEESPADEAGLRKGDEIIQVNSIKVSGLLKKEAVECLESQDIHSVKLSYKRRISKTPDSSVQGFDLPRPGAVQWRRVLMRGRISRREIVVEKKGNKEFAKGTIKLERRLFFKPTVLSCLVSLPSVGNAAYIKVNEFASQTVRRVRQAVHQFSSGPVVTLYVLDLRENSGGILDQAAILARTFLPKGRTIVSFSDFRGNLRRITSSSFFFWSARVVDTPIVVLVDDESASAAEQVAAALRENCCAALIGTRTYGKDTVQVIAELPGGAGMSVTTGSYRTPNGNIVGPGQELAPDLKLHALPNDSGVVKKLFGKGGRKIYEWVLKVLSACEKMNSKFDKEFGDGL